MIDPAKITNFTLDKYQLQEMILFWVLVAGKTAKTTSRLLDRMLSKLHEDLDSFTPFHALKIYDEDNPGQLEDYLKSSGFGCQKSKAKSIRQLIYSNLNLKTCSVEELEKIHGIGPKTARCFLLHTRENSRYAGLDTHVLKWLTSLGHKVPKSTPQGNNYKKLEKIFLEMSDRLKMTPATLDLAIWNAYSSGKTYEIHK